MLKCYERKCNSCEIHHDVEKNIVCDRENNRQNISTCCLDEELGIVY